MAGNRNKLIAFNYFGGKFQMVQKLYEFFPDHRHFIDLFCGSMVVTMNKPLSNIDTANDINGEVINFFRVLREQPTELLSMLYLTPVSREEYNLSWDTKNCSDLERARKYYTRIRQSFYGLGAQRVNKGWHLTKRNSRSRVAETVSKWINGVEKLIPIIDRLKYIQIENRDFRELAPLVDDPAAFFYCDPPYPKESRCSFNDYTFDFSNDDHHDLAAVLHALTGKVMISGYECKTMNELYNDWIMVRLGTFHTVSGKKGKECIWMNYEKNSNDQQRMFD